MNPQAREAWIRFREIRFHETRGEPALAFHPETRVYGQREAQEIAREAFDAGVRAGQGGDERQ